MDENPRLINSFLLYLHENLKFNRNGKDFKLILKELADDWKEMSKEQKEKYYEEYKRRKSELQEINLCFRRRKKKNHKIKQNFVHNLYFLAEMDDIDQLYSKKIKPVRKIKKILKLNCNNMENSNTNDTNEDQNISTNNESNGD